MARATRLPALACAFALCALVSLAVAPIASANPPTTVIVNGETYNCADRTAAQSAPVPLPPGSFEDQDGMTSQQTICPTGQVPAPRSIVAPPPAPPPTHGAVRIAGQAPGRKTAGGPLLPPEGPIEQDGADYFYGVQGRRVSESENVTALEGYMTNQSDYVAPNEDGYHSLAEIWALDYFASGLYSDVEFGWINTPEKTEPWLFVYHFENSKATCYDACGFVQTSNTVGHVVGYPISSPAPLFNLGPTHHYQVYEEGNTGNWYVAIDGEVVGYYPASAWKEAVPTVLTIEETGGEVAAKTTNPKPQTTMGNGYAGNSEQSADWASIQDRAAGTTRYVNFETVAENAPAAYNVGTSGSFTDEGPAGSNFRYGGPGWCGGSPGYCTLGVVTGETTSVTTQAATLHGKIKPDGKTHYYFEYSTSKSFLEEGDGAKSPVEEFGSENTEGEVTASLTALGPGYIYYYRLVALTESSKAYGEVHTFDTGPRASAELAREVTYNDATLAGWVDPNGVETHFYYEYGESTAFGKYAPAPPGTDVSSGEAEIHELIPVTGLKPLTTYYYRMVATNSAGLMNYSPRTEKFTTLAAPPVVTASPAVGLTEAGATLAAGVNPEGAETKYHFEYGPTTAYGQTTEEASAGLGTSNVEVAEAVGGLAPEATYHFRLVATNSSGTTDGKDATFTTHGVVPAYERSFGSVGNGNGELSHPQDGAVAPSGDVYVSDTSNDRVEEFSPTGEFIRVWGSAGTGNGQFESPRGVAVVASGEEKGDVYVVDAENERVQEFSSEGKYMRQFGSEGGGNGQFGHKSVWGWEGPDGVAVAPNGEVYVADEANHDVQVFAPKGATEMEFKRKWGSEGRGNGEFAALHGIAVAPDGNVYVAEEGNPRVQEFSPEGKFITTWGSEGTGNGQFRSPHGVSAASNGDIYVADEGNNRVEEFSPTGGFVTTWGSGGTEPGEFSGPSDVAVASSGIVYVVDRDNNRIEAFAQPSPAYERSFGSVGNGNGELSHPQDGAVAPSGDVYVSDTSNDRVEEFSPTGEFIRVWGSAGTGNGQFESPRGVAVVASGEEKGDVYVVDAENERVQEFSSEGKYMRQFGSEGGGNGQFGHKSVWGWEGPDGVAVAPNGEVYVADEANHDVQVFAPKGATEMEFKRKWGSEGRGNGEFAALHGIAVAPDGNVYVAEEGNPRVQEFSPEGKFITTWGSEGTGNGQFRSPHGVSAASNGDIYVADEGNNRVEEFSPTGGFVTTWGSGGTEPGEFSGPSDVAVASSGIVYVVNRDNNRIEAFAQPSGSLTYDLSFGSAGTENGQFGFRTSPWGSEGGPWGVAVGPNGDVYVTDEGNHRVQEFSTTGEYLAQWGSEGRGDGQFAALHGIAVAPNGVVYVAEEGDPRVQEFSARGQFITTWGSEGTGDGQFRSPHGVSAASNGDIYVADEGNHRIQDSLLLGFLLRL